MGDPISDAIDQRAAELAAQDQPPRLAAPPATPDAQPAADQPNGLSRFAQFATSGQAFLSAISGGHDGQPGAIDISKLPGYIEKPLDILANPVGIGSIVAAALTGGASAEAEAAVLPTIAARAGSSALTGLAGGLVGGETSKIVADHIPENAPDWVKKVAPVAAGIISGAATGHFVAPGISGAFGDVQGTGRGAAAAGTTQELAYPELGSNLLPLYKAGTGLTKTEQVRRFVSSALGRDTTKYDPQVAPIMDNLSSGEKVVANQAALLQRQLKVAERVLGVDPKTGRMPVIDPTTVEPTTAYPADVAAKLPLYAANLTENQIAHIRAAGDQFEQWKTVAKTVGHEVGDRPDVMEGGVYLPRGNPVEDGVDHLIPAQSRPGGRLGSKAGAMKSAVFESQAEGAAGKPALNADGTPQLDDAGKPVMLGNTYPSLSEAGHQYVSGVGKAIVGAHAANQLKALTDADGNPVFSTGMERLAVSHPELVQSWNDATKNVVSIRARANTAAGRAGVANSAADAYDNALEWMQRAQPDGGAAPLGRIPTTLKNLQAEANAAVYGTGAAEPGSIAASVAEDNRNFGLGMDRVVQHINDNVPEGTDRIGQLDTAITNTAKNLDALEARGGKYAAQADALRAELAQAKDTVAQLAPQYQQALNATPRDMTPVTAFPQLNGRMGPTGKVNAINSVVNPQDALTKFNTAADIINQPLRAMHTMMDFAFVSRVGPTALVNDPVAYMVNLGRTFKSLVDKHSADDFFTSLEQKAVASGLDSGPRSAAAAGVNFAGHGASQFLGTLNKDGEVGLTSATQKLMRLPGVARGSQAFNDFSDMLRAQMFQHMVESHANGVPLATRLASGNTMQKVDVADPAVRAQLANMVNRATGSGTGVGPGSTMPRGASAFIQFPNWLQSQLEQVGQAAAGGGLEGAYARQTLLKLIGLGMTATIGVNKLTGNDTKMTNADGSWRVPTMRIGDQNIDVFGPMGSLVNGVMAGARGDLGTMLRSKGSPIVQTGWDLASGTTFNGNKASVDDPGYWARSFAPYGVGDIGGDKSPQSLLLNTAGIRANDETNYQQRVDIAQKQFGKDYADLTGVERQTMRTANPDLFAEMEQETKNKAAAGDKTAQGIVASWGANDKLMKQQDDMATALTSGQIDPKTFRVNMGTAAHDAFTEKQQIRTDFGLKNSATPSKAQDALDRYYKLYDQATVPGVGVDWDNFDLLNAALQAQLTQDGNQVGIKAIQDRVSVASPNPVVQNFMANKQTINDSGYFLVKQVGFDRIKSAVQSLDPHINNPADLATATANAAAAGNRGLYSRLTALTSRMTTIGGNLQAPLLRENPALAQALLENGYLAGKKELLAARLNAGQ